MTDVANEVSLEASRHHEALVSDVAGKVLVSVGRAKSWGGLMKFGEERNSCSEGEPVPDSVSDSSAFLPFTLLSQP